MDKQVEFLVKLRDAFIMASEVTNEYIDSIAPPEIKAEKKQAAAVLELNFTYLKFEAQQGAKLGEYEIAYKQSNLTDNWQSAYNILSNSNATIQDRYHGEDYQYSYWLYGEGKIYRQKLKPKT
jgi:hypothetical protein